MLLGSAVIGAAPAAVGVGQRTARVGLAVVEADAPGTAAAAVVIVSFAVLGAAVDVRDHPVDALEGLAASEHHGELLDAPHLASSEFHGEHQLVSDALGLSPPAICDELLVLAASDM